MDEANDTRNVMDEFKGLEHQLIVRQLDERGSELEVAIENLERDFNMGTIVRSANAMGVRRVHVIGRRQWNKRGAMKTDAYLRVEYHESVEAFIAAMRAQQRTVIALDNVPGAVELPAAELPLRSVLVVGSERAGLTQALLTAAARVVAIPQWGSTRSLNVGVAAGIAMYEWTRRHRA